MNRKNEWIGAGSNRSHKDLWLLKSDKCAADENPCLWKQAGVVNKKACTNFYDCTTCKYDQGMMTAVKKGKRISWQDAMRQQPLMARICRHSLTHRIERRICAYDYQCATCDFDQYFEEVYRPKQPPTDAVNRSTKEEPVPEKIYFHHGHSWARLESGKLVRIGMDSLLAKACLNRVSLDLPLMGNELKASDVGWNLTNDNKSIGVVSPVSGLVLEVNRQAGKNPDLIYNNPFGEGWLMVIACGDPEADLKALQEGAAAMEWTNAELNRMKDQAGTVSAATTSQEWETYVNILLNTA